MSKMCLKLHKKHIQTIYNTFWIILKTYILTISTYLGFYTYSPRGAAQTPADANFWWSLLIFDHFLMLFGHK